MRETDDIRRSIAEFWRAVLFALLAFAGLVVYIFASSALEWKGEQKRLEMAAAQKAIEKQNRISVYAFVNTWALGLGGVRGDTQFRNVEKLEVGEEYMIGRRVIYDEKDLRTNKYGFDHVTPLVTDVEDFSDPVITIQYAKFIHVKYSIDGGNGWLLSAPTARGIKTGAYSYTLPERSECDTTSKRDGWGEKSLTFTVPINGLNNVVANIDSKDVSEEMRGYNYIVTEKLSERYSDIPAEFADRTRKIYTSHVIVEGWRSDPRVWKSASAAVPVPEITVILRIKHYGEWDLTKEEYESLRYKVGEFSSENHRDFSPYSTLVYVGTPVKTSDNEGTK